MGAVEWMKGKLHRPVDSLPPERLALAETLLEQRCDRGRAEVQQGGRMVRLGGLWRDLGVDIGEEDIAQARKEMWGPSLSHETC
jgi:hypothetical protein